MTFEELAATVARSAAQTEALGEFGALLRVRSSGMTTDGEFAASVVRHARFADVLPCTLCAPVRLVVGRRPR